MDYKAESLKKHAEWQGKITVQSRVPVENAQDLSLAYTPGVAAPCLAIQEDYQKSFTLTRRGNLVAVVTDGTAVLGLGDIGPEAGMPVMEGKCVLFKEFGGVEAFPLCVRSHDTDEIVRTVYLLSGSFGGINLEDIAAPRCFEIERKLKALCDIPVFHDDQHGTAIVITAALLNALRLAKKELTSAKIVINGAGSAGIAAARMLLSMNVKDIVLCDSVGIVSGGRAGLNPEKEELARLTNPRGLKGTLATAMEGADVFIGVSVKDCVTEGMVKSMADKPVLFPMANPDPEIPYDAAVNAGAFVVGTGRSDYPNQINNAVAFPGIFRGALDVRASDINEDMKRAAVFALASSVPAAALTRENIIPKPFDKEVHKNVAKAVAAAAVRSGVARI
ncbi:MAG: NAD-dependent malic enzyme [Clostridiales bacterium]|jgi:malate dehydrogenase (oxaloacetate-decarboxylating)|nr:NAD-dependent malic enzyme [Clostridiales bacterium]